jgi:glycine cleavage system H lipoate-binding protein
LKFLAAPDRPKVQEVFGFTVPTTTYLHRGHTWAALENTGRVRVGLDDFSQKVLGPADDIQLPDRGQELHHDAVGLTLTRRGKKAGVLAPLDGIIEAVNPKVRQRPGLTHDDPYGEGWLLMVTPTNLKRDLENMLFGRRNVAWIENECIKLLGMLESAVGVTLPSGGTIIDDVCGHYPELGWEQLVQEFLHTA